MKGRETLLVHCLILLRLSYKMAEKKMIKQQKLFSMLLEFVS